MREEGSWRRHARQPVAMAWPPIGSSIITTPVLATRNDHRERRIGKKGKARRQE